MEIFVAKASGIPESFQFDPQTQSYVINDNEYRITKSDIIRVKIEGLAPHESSGFVCFQFFS